MMLNHQTQIRKMIKMCTLILGATPILTFFLANVIGFFFSHEDRYAKDHTLLMIWPNNPDNVDNDEEFHIGNLPPLWDSDCLSAFIHAGGTSVIYVGERIENIYHLPDKPPEVGLCASAKFQSMLKEKFVLKKRMNIPSWTYDDDVTFWTLKEKIK
mmetsp:Transcript_41410/g.97027  ORF Transcript_41410/g.97027 Transcript_41410/m.97027 type:complete len:156 (-) Transcript_41410:797-1264(-)